MIASDFMYWLSNNGFGTVGIDLFENFQPANPDNCITVNDDSVPGLAESSSLSVDLFGINIIVRNSVSNNAKSIIKDIHKRFIGFGGSPLIPGGEKISASYISAAPQSIGKDEKGRTEYTATYNVRVESKDNEYRL
jgi:hypothetical protein